MPETSPQPTKRKRRKTAQEKLLEAEAVRVRLLELDKLSRSMQIDKTTARADAAAAVATLADNGKLNASGGTLAHLHRICLNGWIKEAADKMLDFYPDLRKLEKARP